jgi:hypothetical protein
MSAYQNIFTQVQVRSHPEMGVETEAGDDSWRIGPPFFVHLIGRIGNAQIGPVHLGWTGVLGLFTGFIAFEIAPCSGFDRKRRPAAPSMDVQFRSIKKGLWGNQRIQRA